MESKNMEQHVTVVAALHIGFGILGILAALIVLAATIGPGLISGDEQALAILTIIGCGVSLFLVVLSVPGIIGGLGLLKHKLWARYLLLIVAVLDLFNIPIGTAVGVYSLWVLVQSETEQLFASAA